MYKGSNCPTFLLSDAPTTQDAFSHSSVASAVADLISRESGGKCIGLVGSWGSGKSSVVDILRAKLEQGTGGGTEVFVFDAWAHQGDTLRRNFLEQLINELQRKRWLTDAERWSTTREKLARRLQITKSVTRPTLTFRGACFSFALLLMPFGLQMWLKGAFEPIVHLRLALFGLELALLPVTLLVATYVYWRPTLRFWTRDFWHNHRRPYHDESIVALFLNRLESHIHSNTVTTPDPTSIEFESVFNEILQAALDGNDRVLVVIIDNLDRVETGEAIKVWSTLRTFFDFGNRPASASMKRFWLLVPFDATAVESLWSDHRSPSSIGMRVESLGPSFVAKTFQITFRVPPPILSDWHDFMKMQLKQAFPLHTDEEFHRIYRIFDLSAATLSTPTPRDIKHFVNHVGAIHRQWQDRIPLPVQAFYVVASKSPIGISSLLYQEEKPFLGNVPVEILSPNWRECLAAIHYSVPLDKALHVLLASKLKGSLPEASHAKDIEDLARIPGFTAVLEKFVETHGPNWAGADSNNLALAIRALSNINVHTDESWTRTWSLLRSAAMKTTKWANLDLRVAEGVAEIAKRFPDAHLITRIVQSLAASVPPETDGKGVDPKAVDTWVATLIWLIAEFRSEHAQILKTEFRVQGSAQTYLRAIASAASSPHFPESKEFLIPQCTPNDVISELAAPIATGKAALTEASVGLVSTLQQLPVPWPWGGLLKQIKTRLEATSANISSGEFVSLFRVLDQLSTTQEEAKATLHGLAQNGYMAHHLSAQQSSPPTASFPLLSMIQFVPNGDIKATPGQAGSGIDIFRAVVSSPSTQGALIKGLADHVRKFDRVSVLLNSARSSPNVIPLVNSVLKIIGSEPEPWLCIRADQLVSNNEVLRRALTPDVFSSIVAHLAGDRSLRSSLMGMKFDPKDLDLYLASFRAERTHDQFSEHLATCLRQMTKAEWGVLFASGSVGVDFISELQQTSGALDLDVEFEDALLQFAKKVNQGSAPMPPNPENWPKLVRAMKRPVQETFINKLVNLVSDSSDSQEKLLILFGAVFFVPEVLSLYSEKMVQSAFSEILGRMRASELKWMSDLMSQNPRLLSSVSGPARRGFESRLTTALEKRDNSQEVLAVLQSIAESARLKPENPQGTQSPVQA